MHNCTATQTEQSVAMECHLDRVIVTTPSSGRLQVRGYLKSSHIADKRKNFHMALYPLPPSSNESVIDNGRSVWQMAMHIILVLPHSLPKQCRLSHVRRGASLKVQCPLRNEQGDMHEPRRKHDFLAFSERSKAGGRCRSPVSGELEQVPVSAFKSQPISVVDHLQLHACTSCLFCLDLFRLATLYWRFPFNNCKRRNVTGQRSCFFFSFFYCRSHNESGPDPLPPI